MKRLLKTVQSCEETIIVASFVIMVIATFTQVVNRNFVGAGISWLEEVSRYCMIYMALLATELGLRDGTQISVTAVTDKLPPRGRLALKIVSHAIVIGFSAAVFLTSLVLLEKQIAFGAHSAGLGMPMYIPYFALPLSFALIALVQAARLANLILEAFDGEARP
jgi:TRAP-type C4-dicarboxylate transport system permease small subunit